MRQTIADTLGIGGIMRGRCVNQIDAWKKEYAELCESGVKEHERSIEYGFCIMQSIIENKPYQNGGNVLNTGHLISNFL